MFILCSSYNNYWELESIQYELLLAEKEIPFFNGGVIKNGKDLKIMENNLECKNIIYFCNSQLDFENKDQNNNVNEIINNLNPNQNLILVN